MVLMEFGLEWRWASNMWSDSQRKIDMTFVVICDRMIEWPLKTIGNVKDKRKRCWASVKDKQTSHTNFIIFVQWSFMSVDKVISVHNVQIRLNPTYNQLIRYWNQMSWFINYGEHCESRHCKDEIHIGTWGEEMTSSIKLLDLLRCYWIGLYGAW